MKTKCAIDDCQRDSWARGWCLMHYKRWRNGVRDISKPGNIKHGKTGTPEYFTWQSLFFRCNNPASKSYHRYGGRGITICDRWRGRNGFANFLADMGTRPSSKHSLDRINNDNNYEPSNCRWVTSHAQAVNRGIPKNNTSGHKGVSKVGDKYCPYIKIDYRTINLGTFSKLSEAIIVRKAAEEKYFKPILEAA